MIQPAPQSFASRIDSAVIHRILGKKEANRLGRLMLEAEAKARQRLKSAVAEAEGFLAEAREEAEAILAVLPDFAALQTRPSRVGHTAFAAMRRVADKYGFAFAALMGVARGERNRAVQAEAMRAVANACPTLTPAEIAPLFKTSEQAVRFALRRGDAS